MGNPDVSGVGSNWYISGSWNSAANQVGSAQSDYDAALAALQTALSTYQTKKSDLEAAITGGVKATIGTAKTAFDTARATLSTKLTDLQTAAAALALKAKAANTNIDSKFETNMNSFVSQLQNVIDKTLTLDATTTNTLDTQLAAANLTRQTNRSAFLLTLTAFFPTQDALNAAVIAYQVENDTLLSLQAKLAYDQASPAASSGTITADQNAITAQQAVVATALSDLNSAKATRDNALSSLKNALTNYQSAIDSEVAILNQAATLMQTSVKDFILALQQAKNDALTSGQAALDAAKAADQADLQQHYTDYPTFDPTITTALENQQTDFLQSLSALGQSSLSAPVTFNTQMDIPALPASGKMSMSQLMQFITLVSVLLDELIREIRRTDSRINELRLTIFSTAGKNEASKFAIQQAWAEALTQADTAYNYHAAALNSAATKQAQDQMQFIKNNMTTINTAIDQLNSEIDDQNSRGVAAVSALNSAIQVSTDKNKIQLWEDHGQLDDLQNQLVTVATRTPTTALTAVKNASAQVISDLKTISGLLSVRPIDETAISAVQLTQHKADLAAAISALGTPSGDTAAILDGLNTYIDIVTSDQTTLQTGLHSAEVNAAGALNTQTTTSSTSLSRYSQDIARVISTLAPTDPNIAPLTALKDAIDPVVTALNTLSTDLTTLPINLTTLTNDRAQIVSLLAAVTTARNDITLSSLTGPASDNVTGVDAAVVDLNATLTYLLDYTTNTSSTPTIPPTLPGQVTTPLMPAPTQLEHLSKLTNSMFTIPSTLPLKSVKPPREIPEVPLNDIATLNKTIDQINQTIKPLMGRVPGLQLITPVYIKPYIEVRDAGSFLDYSVLDSFFDLLTAIIDSQQVEESLNENPPTNALFSFADIIGKPNITAGGTKASGVGAGTGLEGANLSSGAGSILQTLTEILGSTEFASYVTGLLSKSGVVGGLAALQNLAAVVKPVLSQFGIIQTPQVKPTAPTTGLTAAQQLALATGVKELVATAENVPQLKSDLLALLKGLETSQKLNEEEIKQLLSLLLFLIQLLALLIGAAALVGAGAVPNLATIVDKAFAKPEDKQIAQLVTDLTALGVKELPKEIAPTNAQFIPTFFNALVTAEAPAQREALVAKVALIFTEKGVTLDIQKPLGTAIKEALTQLPIEVAGKVREQLTQLAQAEGDRVRDEILRDSTKRPSLTVRLQELNPEAFKAIPQKTIDQVTQVLNKAGPTIPGLTTEDRNSLVISLLAGTITPEQAKPVVDQFLREGNLKTNPEVANLAVEPPKAGFVEPPVKPGTLLTPIPQTTPKPGAPGELQDAVAQVSNAIKTLSKQTSDDKFLQETTARFADTVQEQSDFYQKSLTLLLDPANTYVKNFSIVTRQTTGHDSLGPTTQIPIAG